MATAVLHVIDALDPGGSERVALNLLNAAPRDRFVPYVCMTRREGALAGELSPDVKRLCLGRCRALDIGAALRLRRFVQENEIRVIHAHSTSGYLCAVIASTLPAVKFVWHVHCGRYANEDRAFPFRSISRAADGVIVVNRELERWARTRLALDTGRIWRLPNAVWEDDSATPAAALPGVPGRRVIAIANIRPQKAPLNLIAAIDIVRRRIPDVHLIMAGAESDPALAARVRHEIAERGLDSTVSLFGMRSDVSELLRGCDVGVLSSATEGLPVALLEYGAAGLPAIATRVGDCPEVIADGEDGFICEPGVPEDLAAALIRLLEDPSRRKEFGQRFANKVRQRYGARAVSNMLADIYAEILCS